MNKLATAFLALALMVLSSSSQASNPYPAQSRCTLTEATAPAVRGIKLGMSAQQFVALFPALAKNKEMRDAIDKFRSATGDEAATVGFDPVTAGDAHQFAGILSVSASAYRGRVVDFTVQYGGANWRSVDEWIAKLSESFNLKKAPDWVSGYSEAPSKTLNCDGVMIEAAIQGGSASIRVMHNGYLREIEERAKAAEDRKRQDVKP